MTTSDLMVSAGSMPRKAHTSAIVLVFGVATSSSVHAGNVGTGARETASSTLAAYPHRAQMATRSSPAWLGAMNSCEPAPPIMPGSLSTTKYFTPQRS